MSAFSYNLLINFVILMWCWRRVEEIGWTYHVKNKEVLQRDKEERNILHKIKRRKSNWVGYTLLRNCLLKHVTDGKVEGGETGKKV
jgi:hypothetical protein